MAKEIKADVYKEKFRPADDAALDQQIDAALSGLSEDELYGDLEAPTQSGGGGDGGTSAPGAGGKGMRRGRIVSISKDDVFVDFGGKSQGIASLLQFDEEPKVGQEMEFSVERYDPREGVLVLTRKGAAAQNVSWESLEVGQIVEGTVTGVNKGGLELSVKNMRAFMPAGQVDVYHVPDIEQFIGQKMTAEVTAAEREGRNLVLSRRNVVERERQANREKLLEELSEGQIRRGTVRSVMDFGAFVDLGGIDGLLHVSELAFRKIGKASDVVKVGDVLDVKILKVDRAAAKLSLSLKQARGVDPWADAATKYGAGVTITGRVTRIEPFGAFIEVEEGVEGLLPISEMSYQRIKSPKDLVKEGDTLKLVVLSVDPVAKRISFSLKQAGPDPWKTVAERYATDMVVKGTVTRTADFGAFVELEPGLEGLVHISEISDRPVRSANDAVKPGHEVLVRVKDIDAENRRISLSIRNAAGAMTDADRAAIAATASNVPKKNRPQLRGGLDFNYAKNKDKK